MEQWHPQLELDYWEYHPDKFYLEHIAEKYNFFNVGRVCEAHFKNIVPEIAIDIGGGKLGGALYWYNKANQSYLIDWLAEEFKAMGKIPKHVEVMKADFESLPLAVDVVDIIFAWEVYDHALTLKHFKKGIQELERVLKPNGLLFLQHVTRKVLRRGHTVIVKPEQICEWLGLELIQYKEDHRVDDSIRSYFTFTKY